MWWMYFVVFAAALAVDTIPVVAPPAWAVLIFLSLRFHLNLWIVVVIGVTGSTLGRYILSLYIPRISSRLMNRREDKNLSYLGNKLAGRAWSAAVFVFVYTLTPLSTTALFTAAGLGRVRPMHTLPPFFCGRLIWDGVMVYSGKYAVTNAADIVGGQLSWKNAIPLLLGLLVIGVFLFVDWRCLLEHRKLRLRFRIFR